LLEVDGVTVRYSKMLALNEVSLKVMGGEIVSIIGSNGAGKTTLLKTICGLIHPDSGIIRFLSKEIQNLPPHSIVKLGITMVPEGRQIFGKLTVKENLLVGAFLYKSKEYREEALDYVYRLFPRLKERESQLAESLSGGEQQMLAIARALMSKPKLLCLDEPSQGLAPHLVERIFEFIKEVRGKITVLLVEQNVHRALKSCERAYVLENGRITLSGRSEELLLDERVKTAYLGM